MIQPPRSLTRSSLLSLTAAALLALTGSALEPVQAFDAQSDGRSASELESGIALYNKKDYRDAAEHFKLAVELNPKNAVNHYYYANALAFMKERDGALYEYGRCCEIAPRSQFGVYSRMAIETAARHHKEKSPKTQPRPVSQVADSKIRQPDAIDKALSIIRGQAEVVQRNAETEWQARATSDLKRGEYRASDLQHESEAMREIMSGAWVRDGYGHAMRQYSAQDIQAMQRRYEQRISDARERARREAAYDQLRSQELTSDINASLVKLEEQLYADSTHSRPNAPRLQAVGTNLYVRMYKAPEFTPRIEPQEELLATQERLVLDKHIGKGGKRLKSTNDELDVDQGKLILENPNGKSARAGKLGRASGSSSTNLKVSGKLLHL